MLLLFLYSVSSYGGEGADNLPISVKTGVDKTPLFIGDRVTYTIEVKAGRDIEVKLPEFGDNLAEFPIKNFGSSKGGFWGTQTLTQWYLLDIYETGKFTIPGPVIQYREKGKEQWNEVLADEVNVEVQSVLDADTDRADIRDIKGPVHYRNWTYLYIIFAVAVIIIAIILIVRFIRKRKKSREEYVPPVPAHEIAYSALDELIKKNYIAQGLIQQYYFELSDIVRHYLENRFQLKAPEMTTEEFLSALKTSSALDADQKSLLRDFLSHCDMVKFAKYIPGEREIGASQESARKLIDQTREKTTEGVAA